MGHSTSSGRTASQNAGSANEGAVLQRQEEARSADIRRRISDDYLERSRRLHTNSELNDLIEEAANDERLENADYERIYSTIIRRIQRGDY